MKKLISILAFCFISTFVFSQGYQPIKHIIASDAIFPTQKTPLNGRTMYFDSTLFVYRDFQNTTEVLVNLTSQASRFGAALICVHQGGTLTGGGAFIGGVRNLYWFRNGAADSNLVKFPTDTVPFAGSFLIVNNLSEGTPSIMRTNLGLGSISTLSATAGGTNLSGSWPDPLVVRFNGNLPSYYLNYNNLTNTPVGLSLTTTGASGGATYNSGTGVLNIPIYSTGSGGSCLNCNADTIAHIYLDASNIRNNYVITLDSINGKFILAPQTGGGGGGSGTVTNLTFSNANGFTGSISNPSTTPNITLGTSVTGLLFGNGTAIAAATVSSPLTYSAGTLGIQVGNTSQNGYITSTDWNTFNGKQAALSGTGYVKFSGTTPSYLTPTQATADLNLFTTSLQGLAPASGGGTTNFLRADGTWAAPPGGGGSGTVTTFSAGTLSPLFTTSVATATTTPALTFTLSNAAANSILGNNTGSSAAPTYFTPTATTLNNWFGGTILGNSLTSGNILIGNVSNVATSVTPSGDWTISNTGVATLKNTGVGAGTCTNCNVTFDNQGRETGYSSGSNVSSFWTPETFGAVADGVTDCTLAFQRAIDSAALTKGTVLLSKGVYLIRCSYRDTATVYKPSGLYLRTNVTIDGPGSGAVVKISAPPVSSTFTQIAAPLTWSTNTLFFSLFHLDTVSGVILRNFRIDGNVVNQINRFGFDAYKNPQDGTTTNNVQTNAIDLRGGANNTIYNVRIDSVSGYGIRDSGSISNNYNYITVTTTINGGVYYSFAPVNGSILQNSLLTNSWCDNVRIRSSNVSVFNNEISFAKFNVNGNGGSFINFAGLYIESGTWGDVVGMNISGNYIHDNSAYGIDGNTTDTLRYTYPGQSALIANNVISFNGAGGVQVALPFMSVKGNNIVNNAATLAGIIDSSASQCFCSVHIGNASIGTAIIGNDMRDTRKKQKNGGLNGTPIALLTYSGNTASGMSINNSAASSYSNTAPYNSVFGNSYIDTNNVVHNDFATDGLGNLHIVPTNGQNGANVGNTYFGDGTNNAGIFGNYKTGGGTFAFVSQMASVNQMRFDLNNLATYSGTVNLTSGRQIIFADATNSLNRAGIDQNGTLFVGTTGSSYALKVSQIGTDLATVNAGVEAVATGNGSTANIVQAAFKSVLNAGYTGSGYPMAAYFLNSTAGTGNSIAGASAIKGNFGFYSGSNSATASGTNIGGFGYASAGLRCVGLIGDATLTQANSASAVSIGVVGFGLRNNASAIHVGGYFGLQSAQPTFANAALIADNGATSDPVFLARVNGTTKVQVNSAGNLFANTTTDNNGFIQIGANTTTISQIFLNGSAADVTSPTNGMFWYNSTAHTLNFRDNGATTNLLAGGYTPTLTYTQNATNNTLALTGATTQNFLTATTNLAGLLDTARTRYIDSLKNGLKTFTLTATNGLTALTSTSFGLGGTLTSTTNIATGGNDFSITGTTGSVTIAPKTLFGGVATRSWTPGSLVSTANCPILFQPGTLNDITTASSGTVSETYAMGITGATQSASNTSVTYTTAFGVYINGAPTAGTNVTIGTSYALGVAGDVLFKNGVKINAGQIGAINSISGTYPISALDYVINCTSGTFTTTLPAISAANKGQIFVIKNSGVGVITLATTGGDTIDGSATSTLATLISRRVMSDGTSNWIIL